MRTLLLAATLLATVAVPAVAAPRTLVCGPFSYTDNNGQPAQLGPLTFVVDPAVPAGQVIEPSGEPANVSVEIPNEHLITLKFYNSAVMGNTTTYILAISNDHGGATLATYSNSQIPFARSQCRVGSRIVF
ncbi:hypothetical protein VY88_24935 [Azospirillum thiophilum]|uniref:Uncharacterized protein n=1 Tax=Azospirillum thiophilum TaxID=528244 RepID=A0AAC8W5P6_9PROT|nr:hypothetical protein [Azospirillum thiophilum]ALG75321.1 hypothetical protein AL072_30945 [Azospirillum thiophilum]KJR62236.1 hypothetical protein VY88_24935 [Azospirillum thiophilum]